MIKYIIIFLLGFLEQCLYTLYLISVNKYMIEISSVLMFIYFSIYLIIIDKAIKDKNSLKMMIVYAASCGIGNWVIMTLRIIK